MTINKMKCCGNYKFSITIISALKFFEMFIYESNLLLILNEWWDYIKNTQGLNFKMLCQKQCLNISKQIYKQKQFKFGLMRFMKKIYFFIYSGKNLNIKFYYKNSNMNKYTNISRGLNYKNQIY